MPAHGVHYPHGTIESAGHSLSGHASTLHSSASAASGIHLPSNSLGSIGSSHAGAAQTHISGVSGHINAIAEREGHHGDTLVANSTNMRNTDEEHASVFNGLGGRPLAITNGPGPAVGGGSHTTHVDYGALPRPATRPPLTPAEQAALDAKKNRLNAAGAGLGPRPSLESNFHPTPAEEAAHEAAMNNYLHHVPQDTSYPSAPHQPPSGTTEVPLEAHNHMGGELKPFKKPGLTGGHVGASDYHGYTNDPANPWKTPLPGYSSHNVHGHGVITSSGTASAPSANGVYDLTKPHFDDGTGNPMSHNGKTPTKPISTMFPQGVPAGQVWGMGEQAWNGGNPAGGHTVTTGPHGPGGTWEGHAQVPYTPIWNPGGPDHGSGDGNNAHAGETVGIAGYSRPMVPGDPTMHPATYFPKPPADQPVPNPDNSWIDNTPKRDYGDPNYPGM